MDSESTYLWPREATSSDMVRLEEWLVGRGWEVDPTVYMAGARGAAVQVRRIGADWADGEAGLLILPAETVVWDGRLMQIVPPGPVSVLSRPGGTAPDRSGHRA
ncbi:hypothetical protein ACFWUW_10645 [Streptomyces sp. NPDC058655]|uniref:hypothetical protein n=1 Tax=Streptomyces sp. NPDC058655 TaxID=3346577 RepID=UPI0036507E27